MDSLTIYSDIPDPLRLLCLKKIIREPSNLRRYVRYMSRKSPVYVLPTEIADLLAKAYRDYALTNKLTIADCDEFFKNFKNKYIPLSRIDFSGLPISEKMFTHFLEEYQSQLNEINISQCPELVDFDLRRLNVLSQNQRQKILIIGETSTSYGECKNYQDQLFDEELTVEKLVLHHVPPSTHDIDEFSVNRTLSEYLTCSMTRTLRYLDLSNSLIGKGSALMHLESLEVLILYNCKMTYPNVISTICQLKKLCVLDLSRNVVDDYDGTRMSGEDNKLLDQVMTKLTGLKSLDISGTCYIRSKDSNISIFESRADKPFEFLGLFHTGNGAAYRSCIPAVTIAGEANETQILNACEAYMDRPEQLSKALNDLYNLYKTITPSETFNSVSRALDVVLAILKRHIGDEQVIVYTTAALWCIAKINVTTKDSNDAKVRRAATSRLLDVMHYHRANHVILINGGLTLLFMPDIISEHSRVAAISLHMCQNTDSRTQGFGTTLLNALACQVGGDQKIYIGELKAIETMTEIIKAKIRENNCDEILETAWSTLWNITDETPINCERFLQCDGFEAFEDCMDKFSHNKEVLRNMMGLLGNVAECKSLRKKFMQDRYIRRFESLLLSPIDGIECSYNACGILAHLISEGQGFWDTHLPVGKIRFNKIMAKMCPAIDRWPINSRRNINYRSFEPIVRLLDLNIAPAAQYWAVFALANLTRINPAKYCPMLLPFDGLVRLRRLAEPHASDTYVCNLAAITVYQYDRFESEKTLAGLEQCDSIDLKIVRNFRAKSIINCDGTGEMGEVLL